MGRVILGWGLAVVCSGLCLAAAAASSEGLQELAACLKQVPASHPRLFFTDAATGDLKAKIEGDVLLRAAYGHLVAAADVAATVEPLERKKEGKRLLGVSRAYLQRVSYLAFAYRMTREQRYLEGAKRQMAAAAAFEDWNPSHFLDVAEMTAALAVGYDWLYNDLDPETRDTVRKAIIGKGLETSMEGGWWVTTASNWNQVCHGGLVLGALAVVEDNPDLAGKVIARAIENVPRAMEECEPDGVYPEGPSYWEYGTTYNLLMIAALESALGSDFGLATAPAFMKTPEFYLHATGPTGLFFNFSDCGARGGIAPAMHWFARRREEPSLLWRENQELEQFASEKPDASGGGERMLALLLIWGRPMSKIDAPRTLNWKGEGRTPVAMLRSAWEKDATYVAVKGGSPGTSHAHMDIGSFVLDMKGVRWAIDLGSQGYHGLESRGIDLWNKSQDSERWTVFRLSNHSHNTLVVDGQLQRVDGNGTITRFSDEAAHPFAVVDMTSVYAGQLARAVRGVRLMGESVLIQDEIGTLDHSTSVRWAMATHAEVSLDADDRATLREEGQTLSFRVLSPKGVKLTVRDIENPPRDYDEKNPNTRMIGFEVDVAASTTDTWVVFLDPGEVSNEKPAPEAIEKWR